MLNLRLSGKLFRAGGLATLLAAAPAWTQDAPVSFSNSFDTERLVYGPDGLPLVGTNYLAQLYLDTPTGLLLVGGNGTGLFRDPGTSSPGTWSGGTRFLPGISYDQPVQLEVRVWDRVLYDSYEAAVSAGGIAGTSGLFGYTFSPSTPPSPVDSRMNNLPSIRLMDLPSAPPLIEGLSPRAVGEGAAAFISADVSGGAEPLSYRWQVAGGRESVTTTLELPPELMLPGLLDLDLVISDALGRTTPPFPLRLEITNRAPEIRQATAAGVEEGAAARVRAEVVHAWPASAIQTLWRLEDGRTVAGLEANLPLLPPGQHAVELQVEELGLVPLYDNLGSVAEPAAYHVTEVESGDELLLSDTGGTIHELAIYCFADLSGMTAAERGAAGGRLVLRRNDGPLLPGTEVRTPGSVLFESGIFRLGSGYFLQRFPGLNIPASERLTWTVEWINLPQTAGRNAGLVLADSTTSPASTNAGQSRNDYWIYDGERWTLGFFGSEAPPANFACLVVAVGSEVIARSEAVTVSFSVANVEPEIISLQVPPELEIGQSGTFQALADDSGSEPLEYLWNFGDGTTALGNDVGHAYSQSGTYSGKVRVSDAHGGIVERNFIVSVAVDRRPLVFTTVPPIQAMQDQGYTAKVALAPPGSGQVITLQPVTLPSWLTWQPDDNAPAAGSLVGWPTDDDVGVHQVILEAADGVNSERLTVSIVVLNANDPPVVDAPSQVQVPVRRGLPNIGISLADPDEGDVLMLTARSLDPTRLPQDRLHLEGEGRQFTLSLLPMTSGTGDVAVELEAGDGRTFTRRILTVSLLPPSSFTVTAGSSAGGRLSLDPDTGPYEEEFPLRIVAVPQAGWELRRWLGLPGGPVTAAGLDLTWPVTAAATVTGDFADVAAPLVEWEQPAPGLVADRVVTLGGRVTDNDRVSSVHLRASDAPAQLLALEAGRFSVANVQLNQGANHFTIEAVDAAGNGTTNSVVLVWEPGSLLLVGRPADTREGQVVSFPVQLQNRRELAGLSFNLHFEDYLEALTDPVFDPDDRFSEALVTVNISAPGVVRVSLVSLVNPLAAGLHELGHLRLRVRSLQFPQGLQAFVDPELLEVSDVMGDPVPGVGGVSGEARLLPRTILADANGNGRLDIGDASLVQRLVTGLDPRRPWDVTLNDLNGSGTLDSGDVVRVMRAAVGLDAQPASAAAGESWPSSPGARRAAAPEEWFELAPAALSVSRGDEFEVQVRIRKPISRLRGLRFRLNYPARHLALASPAAYQPGPMVPAGGSIYWNDATPGALTFGAVSDSGWPAEEGVAATFKFRVSRTVPVNWNGRLELTAVEVAGDGYNLLQFPDSHGELRLNEERLAPRVSRLRLNDNGVLQFDVLANLGATLVLEGTDDLTQGFRNWRPLATRIHDQLPVFFAPHPAAGDSAAVRFFRIRGNPAALLNPGSVSNPTP